MWPELEPVYRRVLETGEAVVNRETSGKLRGDPDREHIWLASFYPVRLEEEVIGVETMVLDITERKRAELKLKHLSEHDPLTGTYNGANYSTSSTGLFATAPDTNALAPC